MMLARYGPKHPIYQIKVLGEFPEADVNLLFAPEDIDKFMNNDVRHALYIGMPIEFGVDIGRSENKSICCIRQGERILSFEEKYLTGGVVDEVEIVQWIIELINAYHPQAVKIDAIGIGSGVYDQLKRLYPKIIMPVIGNATAEDQDKLRYTNLRAKGYWGLHLLLPTLHCGEIPEELITALGNLHWKYINGKISIQSKEEYKAQGQSLQSPDHLDSLMYAFMNEEDCQDKFYKAIIPISLVGTLDGLTKKSPLDMNTTVDLTNKDGKWSVLHA